MFNWFRQKCAICKGKMVSPTAYIDDKGKAIKVCYKCLSYAERRAYRKQ